MRRECGMMFMIFTPDCRVLWFFLRTLWQKQEPALLRWLSLLQQAEPQFFLSPCGDRPNTILALAHLSYKNTRYEN
jgi:hypothetical protein